MHTETTIQPGKDTGTCEHGNFPPCALCAEKNVGDQQAQSISVPESQERNAQEHFFSALQERLSATEETLTDVQLTTLVTEIAKAAGLKQEFGSQEKPYVFYRAMRNTPEVQQLVAQQEMRLRPFSFAAPGKWNEKDADLPLAYGGENPILVRIIDTGDEWQDTSEAFGMGQGAWNEAMSWDQTVLREVARKEVPLTEAYRQVGLNTEDAQMITEVVYVVDKEKTRRAQKSADFTVFANDAGWWQEVEKQASARFSSASLDHGNATDQKLQRQFLKMFDGTLRLDRNAVTEAAAKTALERAQLEIMKLVKRAVDAKEDDPSWTPSASAEVFRSFSQDAWNGYYSILAEKTLGTQASEEQKAVLREQREALIATRIAQAKES